MKSILVVCMGNICRSPMGEGFLASRLPTINVHSAGLAAVVGAGADPITVKLMLEKGVDVRKHVAKQINQSLCKNSDLILVMENSHRDRIESLYPFCRGKVFLITGKDGGDVLDPYRRDLSFFENALNLIDDGSKLWAEKIKKITALKKI